jgi:CheY-like chemotaxis protein
MGTPVARRAQILVVDDERGVREALRLLLEEDYDVSEAGDGSEALAMTRKDVFDLILLDIKMPGVGGLEILERVRHLAPTTKVILLTALDAARPATLAMKLGATDYVTKPFDGEDLLDVVRLAVGTPRPVRDRREAAVVVLSGHVGWRSSLAALLSAHLDRQVLATSFDVRYVPWDAAVLIVDVVSRETESTGSIGPLIDSRPGSQVVIWGDANFHMPPAIGGVLAVVRGRRAIGDVVQHVTKDLHGPALAMKGFSAPTIKAFQIVSHAYATTSVEDVAGAVYVSSRHLARLFREDAGITLKTFLLRVRVEAAKTLLRESSTKLEVIAETVGLYDASHMTRVFRQLEGVSPRAFREAPLDAAMPEQS